MLNKTFMGKNKIAFDLDGIFIDKPPLIPKKWLEYVFKGPNTNVLSYRFPNLKIEQLIRQLSHYYLLRPPIKSNINLLKQLRKTKKYKIYLISSRYSFLKKETHIWLEKRGIKTCFDKIILNKNNLQPHLFKEKELRKIQSQFYFEDDKAIVGYLKKRLKKTKIIFVEQKKLRLPHFY